MGKSPGEGKGYPLQYSALENSMDCIVRGVSKSQTRLSDFHFTQTVFTFFKGLAWNTAQERASLMAQGIKYPPVMQETQETSVRSLGREDPMEKEKTTHSSILPWRIPWTV